MVKCPPLPRPFSMAPDKHQTTGRRQTPEKRSRPPPSPPRPSASIVLLSPTNQVLLLHRVQTSSSFASAHVFPGGNLSAFHEGEVPTPEAPERHLDSKMYRLAAVRETFEESGILLARPAKGGEELLAVAEETREAGRKEVHSNRVKFTDWLTSVGGVPDIGVCALLPSSERMNKTS